MLLEYGADVMLRDSTGKIALHYCAERAHFLVTKLLMSKGSKEQLKAMDLQGTHSVR